MKQTFLTILRTSIAKYFMRLRELIRKADEASPPKSYCTSTPKDQMSASWKASCKSRALVTRDGKKSHKLGPLPSSRTTVGGKKIKGAAHGGPLPDYGSGSKSKSKRKKK
jgi:hypothetical protein